MSNTHNPFDPKEMEAEHQRIMADLEAAAQIDPLEGFDLQESNAQLIEDLEAALKRETEEERRERHA